MARRIPVYVYAHDPVTRTGIAVELRGRNELQVIEEADLHEAEVAVVAVDELDDEAMRIVRALGRSGRCRVVLVASRPDEAGLLAAVEAGACGLLRRNDATAEALTAAVRSAAAGDGTMPPDLLGRLLSAVSRLHQQILDPRGLTLSGLSAREVDVLRLCADGFGTSEIAEKLSYSERTIKNIIHHVTVRLNLRNRTHAVAYALRQGLI